MKNDLTQTLILCRAFYAQNRIPLNGIYFSVICVTIMKMCLLASQVLPENCPNELRALATGCALLAYFAGLGAMFLYLFFWVPKFMDWFFSDEEE